MWEDLPTHNKQDTLMKPCILLFILIISIIPFTLVSDTDTQITVVPDIPRKFKICVLVVKDDDTHLDEKFESFLRRELRVLGDVELVRKKSAWHYLLAYSILEHTSKGIKTGDLSTAETVLEGVVVGYDPKDDFASDVYGRPGYFQSLRSGLWTIDSLHECAIGAIGSFDKDYLEPLREE